MPAPDAGSAGPKVAEPALVEEAVTVVPAAPPIRKIFGENNGIRKPEFQPIPVLTAADS